MLSFMIAQFLFENTCVRRTSATIDLSRCTVIFNSVSVVSSRETYREFP